MLYLLRTSYLSDAELEVYRSSRDTGNGMVWCGWLRHEASRYPEEDDGDGERDDPHTDHAPGWSDETTYLSFYMAVALASDQRNSASSEGVIL